MNVRELIERLKKMKPETPVIVRTDRNFRNYTVLDDGEFRPKEDKWKS